MNFEKTKKESLAIINGALTTLNNFPELDDTNTNLSVGISANPFPFLMDLFKSTVGYDILIRIISRFIALGLPPLELAIKAQLLMNIKNLLTCSLNPFISKELLMNGVVFDLRTVDVMSLLSYCPLSEEGDYMYFGCRGMKQINQLVRAADFNAFMWYVKNKSARRRVWYGVNFSNTFSDSAFEKDENDYILLQKEPGPVPTQEDEKCTKKAGIITLSYCERPNGVRNCEGNGLSYDSTEQGIVTHYSMLQIPHHNCLQVFLGNTQDDDTKIDRLENEIDRIDVDLKTLNEEKESVKDEIFADYYDIETLNNEFSVQKIDEDYYHDEYNRISSEIEGLNKRLNGDGTEENKGINGKIAEKEREKKTKANELNKELKNLDSPDNYRKYYQNYYYNHTLIEFNTDYVMSLKLFDSKTITTQLLDALTGFISIDLNLSYEQLIVKYETQKMVKGVIENDDVVINDCFFTFSNEDYDNMLKKSELTREKLYAMNVNNPTGVTIDKESVLETLNSINDAASKENIQSVIEGSLIELSKQISDVNYTDNSGWNFGAQINFIENIINNLAYVITMSILSPKVYLLFAINLKILGRESTATLDELIEKQKEMLVGIIRLIRDKIIEYLLNELTKILADLSSRVAIKLTAEQAMYYADLIRRLYSCITFGGNDNDLDFNVDNVDYADIYDEESAPQEEC